MSYPSILLISIIPLFIIYWKVFHKQRSLIIYINQSLDHIKNILRELSLDMNNQTLCISAIQLNNEMRILKYQQEDTWGMKVILDSNTYRISEEKINLFVNDDNIPKEFASDDNIIFDLGSDLLKVHSFVKFILTRVLDIQPGTKFNFVFEKKSLTVLRLRGNV